VAGSVAGENKLFYCHLLHYYKPSEIGVFIYYSLACLLVLAVSALVMALLLQILFSKNVCMYSRIFLIAFLQGDCTL
jgi:hypothetical protein